jgi:hypothetical protein
MGIPHGEHRLGYTVSRDDRPCAGVGREGPRAVVEAIVAASADEQAMVRAGRGVDGAAATSRGGCPSRRLRARSGPAPQLPPHVERRLLAVAIAEASWGCARLAADAQRLWPSPTPGSTK